MLRSGFAEQFVEADVLLFIEAERVFIAQRSGLLSGLVCQFSVGIHNIGSKGVRLGRTPGLAERAPLSDKCQFVGQRYSSLPSGDGKKPRRRTAIESLKTPPLRLPGLGLFPVQYYNRPVRKKKPAERTGAVVSGHRNRGISVGCILQHERSVFLFRSLSRYKPHETENGILNGLKHKTGHTRFTTANRTFNLKNVAPWIH